MRNRKHHGIALITAIWILALLLILVGGLAAMVHSESKIAENFGQLTHARWAAVAGIRRAEVEVLRVAAQPATALGDGELTLTSQQEETNLDHASYTVVIADEAGKLNLNSASPEVLGKFFPPEVADPILDWRDTDNTPRPQGAEDDYYTGLAAPYHCKNKPFDTVDELLLVKGVTPELLAAPIVADGHPLRALLTVYSHDRNVDAHLQPRINIATASKDDLARQLGDVFTAEEITAIIQQRTTKAFTSPADLLEVPKLSREKVGKAYDRLTTTTAKERPGLLNINTAPAELLAGLPGMDDAAARAIVAQRTDQGPFTDVGELLTISAVTNTTFQQVADLLTTRSTTFCLHATGQAGDGITRTVTSVVQVETDAQQQSVLRTLYWRER